jgi:hypothetical protein
VDEKPIHDERIIEAIEVYRRGDDLSSVSAELDPAAAELMRRIQETDEVISVAFKDVPMPEGLAERLLDRLATSAEVAAVELPEVVRPKRVSRRWAVAGCTLLTVAAGLLVAAWIGSNNAPTWSEGKVLAASIKFFNSDQAGGGYSLAEAKPPGAYLPSRDILLTSGTKWRRIEGFLGRKGVAYDLSGQGGSFATLYVVKRTVSGLPSLPPRSPRCNTGGVSTAAWQEGDLLYVLVIHGGSGSYRRLIAPLGPVA